LPSTYKPKTLDELANMVKESAELYLESESVKAEGKVELVGVQFTEVSAS